MEEKIMDAPNTGYVHTVFKPGDRIIIKFVEEETGVFGPLGFGKEYDYGYLDGKHGTIVRGRHIPYLNQPTYEIQIDEDDFLITRFRKVQGEETVELYVFDMVYEIKAQDLIEEDTSIFMEET
jgi:hypothetical protein